MKNNNLIKVILLVVGAIILIGALTLFTKQSEAPSPQETSDTAAVEELSITLTIEGIYDSVSVPINNDETVLSLLEQINEDDQTMSLVTESYEGLGTLVTAMGGQTNGTDSRYWQYEVNGEMPMVGADNYKLNGDESVVWEFKASEL